MVIPSGRRFNKFNAIGLCFCIGTCLFLCACDKSENPSAEVENAQSESKPPSETELRLRATAAKYFSGNESAQENWISMQLSAEKEINAIVPSIPLDKFDIIKKTATALYPDGFVDRKNFITAQTNAYSSLDKLKFAGREGYQYAYDKVEKLYPLDYVARLSNISKWIDFYGNLASAKLAAEESQRADFERLATEKAMESMEDGRRYLQEQRACAFALKSKRIRNMSDANVERVKKRLADKFSGDFIRQMEGFDSISSRYAETSKLDFDGLSIDAAPIEKSEHDNEDSLKEKSEDIFRKSVFTKHNATGTGRGVSSAVIVKMNGKSVILCSKEFLTDKLPVVFSNSRGKIVCSKAYVSREFPVVLMIPDEDISDKFSPLEIVDAEESANLHDRSLYMIAPAAAGFLSRPVEVFSEDEKFLNLTTDTAPKITRKTNIKAFDRNANRMMRSITDVVEVGEHAVVLDPDSGKLVSISIRKYAPGMMELGGKTGSVVGHEAADLPDFSTLIRQFDGTVSRTSAPPVSSIAFLRLTAFESWDSATPESLKEQKNALRKFTDDNNDFLMFFKYNSFSEALRLDRLRDIAERYRRPLYEDNMDRRTFETVYKKYMIDVLFAMRREMVQYADARSFLSIYRDEMQYQINLRSAMYDYLSEAVKSGNISNVIHADLKTRYYDSTRPVRRQTDSSGSSSVSEGGRIQTL